MLAFFIFFATLILLFTRPFNMQIWLITSLGAAFCFFLNLINFNDIKFIFALTFDSSLTLIALIIFCFSLESLGYFKFIAHKILQLSRFKNRKTFSINCFKFLFLLFVFIYFLSAFFANDGAILIFTPIIIAIFANLKNKNKNEILIFFLLTCAFLCDALSNTFIISNLTNIISAKYLNLGFTSFFKTMFLPNLFAFLASFFFVFLFYKKLPKALFFTLEENAEFDFRVIIFCSLFLIIFLISFFVGEIFEFKISFLALILAVIFASFATILKKGENLKALKKAPWDILIFSFSLFIVVFALHKAGFSGVLNQIYTFFENSFARSLSVGFSAAFGSAIFNNLPMNLLANLSLSEINANSNLIYSNLLGVNIGSKLTPIGSLATLLWLFMLKKQGINISLKKYLKFNVLMSIFVLFFALLALNFLVKF